ncbi:glycopeptide antibiotics resistance protein [Bacillus thermophilus]|uniref:Glycopeptide antibiotics resistance protein n=1 Tax=Siminovitchia thermophila TaxID=1245522 RepID=A0ABS2R4W9_9BACI|nr:VanZ family protein [Siminovitchia thermophila]MBM7714700.1 glycopeptide antibiotics resistance protein [Siminovitchia thermophila]ONK24517.1 hypothetical protein BLX87_05120 [Bacillus sp. VT-16-64]
MSINIITVIGFIGLLLFIIYDLFRKKLKNLLKRTILFSFIFYFIVVATVTTGYIHIPPLERGVVNIQLFPFYFIWDLSGYGPNSWFFWNAVKLSFFNLIMLFPLGVYLPFIFNIQSIKKATLIVFFTSLLIETCQLVLVYFGFLSGRTFNVDDLLLNTLGGTLGFICFKKIAELILGKKSKTKHISSFPQ